MWWRELHRDLRGRKLYRFAGGELFLGIKSDLEEPQLALPNGFSFGPSSGAVREWWPRGVIWMFQRPSVWALSLCNERFSTVAPGCLVWRWRSAFFPCKQFQAPTEHRLCVTAAVSPLISWLTNTDRRCLVITRPCSWAGFYLSSKHFAAWYNACKWCSADRELKLSSCLLCASVCND